MKSKTTLLSLFLLLILVSKAQQPVFAYMYYDTTKAVQANAVANAFDNGFIIAGNYDYKPAVMKMDSAGNVIWNKIIAVNYQSWVNTVGFYCLTRTIDSCYMLAGVVHDSASNLDEIVGVKINRMGDTLWCRKLSAGNSDVPHSIQQTADGGYVIAGINHGTSDFTVALKIDSAGNLHWRQLMVSGTYQNTGSIKQATDGGYVMATTITISANQYATLVKLNTAGNPVWTKTYSIGSLLNSTGCDVLTDSTGFLFYMMRSNTAYLVKTDTAGSLVSALSYSGFYSFGGMVFNNQPLTNHLKRTAEKGYLISNGVWDGNNIIKLDSLFNAQWISNVQMMGSDALETNDGGYLALGNGPIPGMKFMPTNFVFGITKLDSIGNSMMCVNHYTTNFQPETITGSNTIATFSSGGSSVPFYPFVFSPPLYKDSSCVPQGGGIKEYSDFGDITLSPNPFTTATIITFSKEQKNTSLLIYDLTGRIVKKTTINKATKATIEKGEMQPGIYFVEFINDKNQYINKKLIVQ